MFRGHGSVKYHSCVGHKVTIVLIWLALPLAALLLLRADYERYERELDSQLRYATAYKDVLVRYSTLYDNRGREVLAITDPQSRINWEQRFREIGQQLDAERKTLGSSGLSHYPQTAALFARANEELAKQRDNLQDASRLQDAFSKSQGNVDELRAEAWDLYWQAEQYRQIGAAEIFYQIQDMLAQLESQISRRDRRRFELTNELTLAMNQANTHRAELRDLLATLPQELAKDQGRTYREDLAQRFRNFNLVQSVKQLITGQSLAQGRPLPRIPNAGR
jgi:hypothetical protein